MTRLSYLFLPVFLLAASCGDDGDDPGADAAGSDAATADASTADAESGDAGATSFEGNIIAHSCAPNDGPALDIVLGEHLQDTCVLTEPSVRISIFTRDITAPETIAVGGVDGMALRCPVDEDGCEVASSGSVSFESYEEGVAATGTWTLVFGDDELSGSFDAPYCDEASSNICG